MGGAKGRVKVVLAVLMALAIVGFAVFNAVAFYSWPCERLRTNPVTGHFTYLPARCGR